MILRIIKRSYEIGFKRLFDQEMCGENIVETIQAVHNGEEYFL
jgi:hypothetical protein